MGRTLQPTREFIFIEFSFRIAPLLQAPFHTHSLKGSRNSSRYSSSRRFSKSSYHSSRRLSQSSISILSLLIQNFFLLILVSPSLRNLLGLTKFLRTHLGISVVVEFPGVSPKFLRTHLGISVVVEFPRVSPKFLRTHLGISVVTKFPRVSPKFLRTHLRISVVTKFPRA